MNFKVLIRLSESFHGEISVKRVQGLANARYICRQRSAKMLGFGEKEQLALCEDLRFHSPVKVRYTG